MIETISITDARKRFLAIVDEVSKGVKKIMLTKHGRPAAIVLSAEEYFQMRETLDLLLKSSEVESIAKGLEGLQKREISD